MLHFWKMNYFDLKIFRKISRMLIFDVGIRLECILDQEKLKEFYCILFAIGIDILIK